ncbi:M1 family metallopeptidase [Enemella evansiae]|uniref:M1 family metallopeptidase n=1 Tax=Enemella evansiae TaxID=2016499 RepID=UPI000B967AA3|nr:M1 family metallopeptidase [Enemella evansiae]OYN93815.1 peptidase [Enemella evansiae]OYO05890.1 peptidase [Enemella evansiae]
MWNADQPPPRFQQQRPDFRPPTTRPLPIWYWLIPAIAALIALIVVGVLIVRPLLGPVITEDGGDGVGDRYFPTAGGGGYDARDYRIEVSWLETQSRLEGRTTMTAAATRPLQRLRLDLALPASEVRLNGQPVRFTQQGLDLAVTADRVLAPGEEFRVEVVYAGNPDDAAGLTTARALRLNREILFAGQPFGAALWFPSNDHPSDPATMEVIARVPSDLQAISVGALISRDIGDEPDWDTWHWRSDQPMATYLNLLAIGPYTVIEDNTGVRPQLYAVSKQLAPPLAAGTEAALRRTPETVRRLEEVWGPYPFGQVGGVASSVDVGFGALENQTRPLYRSESLAQNPNRLLTHEYAHMWFGNQVTLRQWDDIFMNEGYASFSEWIVTERTGGRSANEQLLTQYDEVDDRLWGLRIDDPGPNRMFAAVYVRGPMALQALRNVLGDEQFFALGRDWVARPGTGSLEEWQQRAQARTSVDLAPFWAAWFSGTTKPARTPQNGFPA